jgi:hypothetical protein
MMEHEQERMQQLLKRTVQPVADQANAELRHDLWPGMRKRLEAKPAAIPWFDWVLAGGVAMWLLFSPKVIPLLLYYL